MSVKEYVIKATRILLVPALALGIGCRPAYDASGIGHKRHGISHNKGGSASFYDDVYIDERTLNKIFYHDRYPIGEKPDGNIDIISDTPGIVKLVVEPDGKLRFDVYHQLTRGSEIVSRDSKRGKELQKEFEAIKAEFNRK
jgi:hypothetical protein